MDPSRRKFLKVAGFSALGLLAASDIFIIKKLLQERRRYGGMSYRDILPKNIISKLDSELRVFGWRSQLENITNATIAETNDGEHVLIEINSKEGNYDCYNGPRKVAKILNKNEKSLEESITGYRGFQLLEGIDYKGIYGKHHNWVEIVLQDNKNRLVRVPIDYNPPYRNNQKELHIGDEIKISPETTSIDIISDYPIISGKEAIFIDISSGPTIIGEKEVNDKNYITGVSMRVEGRPRIMYTALKVPEEDNEKSEHHIVFMDPINLKFIGEYAYKIEKVTRKGGWVGKPTANCRRINLTPDMKDLIEPSIIHSLHSLYNRLNNLKG